MRACRHSDRGWFAVRSTYVMAGIAGPVAFYYVLSFFRADGQGARRLQGGRKALAGIMLSLLGFCGFLLEIVRLSTTH